MTWEYDGLSDIQKRELCIALLEEFGATSVHETVKGELQHRCTLPLGGHTDRNSVTASINYRKLVFKCYVCKNQGGVLWWIATNRHEDIDKSRAWLAGAAGITEVMDLDQLQNLLTALMAPRRRAADPIPTYDERVLAEWRKWEIFHPYLTLPAAEGGRECPEQTLERFKVGYCDHDADWHYQQRLILPLHWRGALVGWQARRLDPDDPDQTKYRNSPDFPRDRTLYGDVDAKDIVLVESPLSVLRHAHHLPMVATLGASVSDLQIPLLHRYRRITLFYDNDTAGWDALRGTKDVPGLFDRLGPFCDLRVVENPFAGADPADLSDAEMGYLVETAIPYVRWRRPTQLAVYERIA